MSDLNRDTIRSLIKLVATWLAAAVISLLGLVLIFTLFVGRDQVELNEVIYENYRLTNKAHSTQLYTFEGRGITTYGEEGLVGDKTLNFSIPRLLFIGDSTVHAKHVDDPEKFSEIVEKDWNSQHTQDPIQTLNAGMDGEDIPLYLSFGRNMDQAFAPSVVFIMVAEGDFRTLMNSPAKLAALEENSEAIIVEPRSTNAVEDYLATSRFRQFFVRFMSQTRSFMAQPVEAENVQWEATADEEAAYRTAVRIQLEALQEIWGYRLVLVYQHWLTDPPQDLPDTFEKDTLLEVAEELGIPVINLYEPVVQAFKNYQPPQGFNDSMVGTGLGHYNSSGHELIAKEIVRFLEQRGPIEAR